VSFCDIGGMESVFCDHCRRAQRGETKGLFSSEPSEEDIKTDLRKASDGFRNWNNDWLVAAYRGRCASCDEPIDEGDEIRKSPEDGGYVGRLCCG